LFVEAEATVSKFKQVALNQSKLYSTVITGGVSLASVGNRRKVQSEPRPDRQSYFRFSERISVCPALTNYLR